jgi:hypothetical protein
MKTLSTLIKSLLTLTVLIIGLQSLSAQQIINGKEVIALDEIQAMHPDDRQLILDQPNKYMIVDMSQFDRDAILLSDFQNLSTAQQQAILNDPTKKVVDQNGNTLRFLDDGTYVIMEDEIYNQLLNSSWTIMTKDEFNSLSPARQQYVQAHPELFKIVN